LQHLVKISRTKLGFDLNDAPNMTTKFPIFYTDVVCFLMKSLNASVFVDRLILILSLLSQIEA
jgi:hypothetical protein